MSEKDFIQLGIQHGFGNGTIKYLEHIKMFGKYISNDQVRLHANSTLIDNPELWNVLNLKEEDYIMYKRSVYNNTEPEKTLQEIYNKTL